MKTEILKDYPRIGDRIELQKNPDGSISLTHYGMNGEIKNEEWFNCKTNAQKYLTELFKESYHNDGY